MIWIILAILVSPVLAGGMLALLRLRIEIQEQEAKKARLEQWAADGEPRLRVVRDHEDVARRAS